MAAEFTPEPRASLFVGKGTAPQTTKVRLVHRATGAVHEAWPVDAREHLAAGDYVREEDYVAAPSVDGEADAEAAAAAEADAKAKVDATEKAKPDAKKGK